MTEKLEAYFDTLEGLSTEELDRSAEQLVHAEKRNAAKLIAHIAEMSRRKGELECGYKNLFEYCVRRLGLSEGSVARRIQVANVCRRFPQLLVSVAENRLSLTVAGMLAPHLREDNVEKLLSECAGMTKREVEVYLVAVKPKPVFAPSIRRQPSRPPESKPAPPSISGEQEASAPSPAPPAEEAEPRRPKSSPSILEPARPPTGFGHGAREERPPKEACAASREGAQAAGFGGRISYLDSSCFSKCFKSSMLVPRYWICCTPAKLSSVLAAVGQPSTRISGL